MSRVPECSSHIIVHFVASQAGQDHKGSHSTASCSYQGIQEHVGHHLQAGKSMLKPGIPYIAAEVFEDIKSEGRPGTSRCW